MITIRTTDAITATLRRQQSRLDKLPQELYYYWVKTTPKKTGNARRQTRLKDKTIEANYPYAERLDQGWSQQAPEGMSKPTERFLQQRLRNILGS